jgi:hypothetical protein
MGHDEPLLADVEEGHHKNAADSAGEAERAIVAQVCILHKLDLFRSFINVKRERFFRPPFHHRSILLIFDFYTVFNYRLTTKPVYQVHL